MKRRSQIQEANSEDLQPIYQDYSISIYITHVSLHHYYFPFGGSKNIIISEISKISLENLPQDPIRWGISTHYLNHWFSLDPERIVKNLKGMNKFLSFELKGKRINPAITPNNAFQVFAILKDNFSKQGRKMIQFASNKDNNNEMSQQQNSQLIMEKIDKSEEPQAQQAQKQQINQQEMNQRQK